MTPPVNYTSCTCCVFGTGTGKLIVEYCRSPDRFKSKGSKRLVVPLPPVYGPVSRKRNWFPKGLKR